jgi:hypothetical protein
MVFIKSWCENIIILSKGKELNSKPNRLRSCQDLFVLAIILMINRGNIMNKLLSLFITVSLAAGLTACGAGSGSESVRSGSAGKDESGAATNTGKKNSSGTNAIGFDENFQSGIETFYPVRMFSDHATSPVPGTGYYPTRNGLVTFPERDEGCASPSQDTFYFVDGNYELEIGDASGSAASTGVKADRIDDCSDQGVYFTASFLLSISLLR